MDEFIVLNNKCEHGRDIIMLDIEFKTALS